MGHKNCNRVLFNPSLCRLYDNDADKNQTEDHEGWQCWEVKYLPVGLPGPVVVDSQAECASRCWRKSACATMIYNTKTRDCYFYDKYATADDAITHPANNDVVMMSGFHNETIETTTTSTTTTTTTPSTTTAAPTASGGCYGVQGGDGVYSIHGPDGNPLDVWCDMTTDGGHWLVIQRRKDGSVNFDQNWNAYKTGFGDKTGEFWLGNEVIHSLTTASAYELRIDMVDKSDVSKHAKYSLFRVGNEAAKYDLYLEGYSGDAGDSFTANSGRMFTTLDSDNDPHGTLNCATWTKGGWWLTTCGNSCLNGMYGNDGGQRGVFWGAWHGTSYSLPTTEMKIRPLPVSNGCSGVSLSSGDGVYVIEGPDGNRLPVWCDMTTDGGRWLVIQRRKDGTVNFDQAWNPYKSGFGDIAGEFWLGNEVIHGLTTQGNYELRIDMVDKVSVSKYAKYSLFRVGTEAAKYDLYVEGYSGDAGDSLTANSGRMFTTLDSDNDPHGSLNCATWTKGGWWLTTCGNSCLNGMYANDGSQRGVFWGAWHGTSYSLPTTEMKIRFLSAVPTTTTPPTTTQAPTVSGGCYGIPSGSGDGVYSIQGPDGNPLSVWCDMTTDGGHWLLIQRRKDGTEDFNQNWSAYKAGFGANTGEFWLGNELIHDLTTQTSYELRIDMVDKSSVSKYVKYSLFRVGDEAAKYDLTVQGYSGDAGDSLTANSGRMFTTLDSDNDPHGSLNCATWTKGGWWMTSCGGSCLNGMYGNDGSQRGVFWQAWHGYSYSLPTTEMKIRPLPVSSGCSGVSLSSGDGVYAIQGPDGNPLPVWCDMTTDGGHWLVIQRRKDGSVDFDKNWSAYKVGFGDITKEFWLGNEVIHGLTTQSSYELRIDMVDKSDAAKYVKYSTFRVGDEAGKYILTAQGYSGDAGDSLTANSGTMFTTLDSDNDPHGTLNCATWTKGGWWMTTCGNSCLNGMYGNDGSQRGVFWGAWHGTSYSLPWTEMKIRVL